MVSLEKYRLICYYLIEQRRSWSFGSRLEFPTESWFALPNRLKAENKGTIQKKL